MPSPQTLSLRPLLDYTVMLLQLVRDVVLGRGWQRWRRFKILLLFCWVYPPLWLYAVVGLALDRMLFPGLRGVGLQRPVFIVGNTRTGSTFLHRLLAKDQSAFATFRFIDFLLPSLCAKAVAGWVARMDRRCGGLGRRLLARLDDAFLPVFAKIHPVGLLLPEEDEYTLWLGLCSGTAHIFFPGTDRFRRFLYLDQNGSQEDQRRFLVWYLRLARRHQHWLGGHKRWLSKNPYFSGKVQTLAAAFPEARFLRVMRDPCQVVPSSASMVHFVWENSGAQPAGFRDPEGIVTFTRDYDEHLRATFAALPAERTRVVDFAQLTRDPEGTVRALYRWLELEVTPATDAILQAAAERSRGYRSHHSYDLEEWGFTEKALRELFPDGC